MQREADVLVVGGGPGGLHAALKAAILNHSVLLVDKGRRHARVWNAPAIANIPGSVAISGVDLLERGRRDLARFEDEAGKKRVTIADDAEVVSLARDGDAFRARVKAEGEEWDARAKVVILATGVVDRVPAMRMSPFLHKSDVGYCILCEGWSLAGKRVAVVGHSDDAAEIAKDICGQFAGDVTFLTDGRPPPSHPAGCRVVDTPIRAVREEDGLVVELVDGTSERYDKAIISLGWHRVNNELARMLGARVDRYGHIETTEDREVLDERGEPIRGLYAIGDVRAGRWKQVPLAWADAEIAVIAAYAERLPTRYAP